MKLRGGPTEPTAKRSIPTNTHDILTKFSAIRLQSETSSPVLLTFSLNNGRGSINTQIFSRGLTAPYPEYHSFTTNKMISNRVHKMYILSYSNMDNYIIYHGLGYDSS